MSTTMEKWTETKEEIILLAKMISSFFTKKYIY